MGWRSLDLIGQQEPRDRALEVPENGRSLGTPGWKKKKSAFGFGTQGEEVDRAGNKATWWGQARVNLQDVGDSF